MSKSLICEALPTALPQSTPSKTGKLEVTLITPGWGSSGHYSAAVLKSAAEAGIWGPGHQMFADHPGENEAYDRPERTIRDLAATLTETARWDEAGQRVVAQAQVFPHMVDMLTDEHFAKSIGVSIRAYAESRHGEAEGRKGQLITRIDEAISTDFVTRAGRGGSIAQVMESARPSQVVERAVTRGVAEATANDIRSALSSVITTAYGAEKSWPWLRDFDEDKAWFSIETPDGSAVYEQSYVTDEDGIPTDLDGDPIEVRARTEYVPVAPATESDQPTNVPAPAGQPHPTPNVQEDTMGTIQVDEAEHGRLTEAAGRVTALETERNQATTELATFKAREAARPAVTKLVGESDLPARRQARIVEAALDELTIGDDGRVDTDALNTAIEANVTEAREELAELAEALGAGKVTAFNTTGDDDSGVESADPAIASAFGRTTKEV